MKVVLYGSPVLSFEPVLLGLLEPGIDCVSVDYNADAKQLATAFEGASAMISVRYDRNVPAVPSLRLVQVPGVGIDEIEMDRVPAAVQICNVSGHGAGVAEYVLLGMLEWRHQFFEAAASFRAGSWERSSRMQAEPHGELAGSVVGIVGYGLIGQSIAQRLQGFDVTTLVCNRSALPRDRLYDKSYLIDELGEMAPLCDFLVICIPLLADTARLVDRRILDAMKSDAVLVNIARGDVVDERALFEALRHNCIGGAIVDVWYRYPVNAEDSRTAPSHYDFAALPNVIMTPHMAGWTNGTVRKRWRLIAENLARLRDGQPLQNVVRPAGGGR